MNARMPRNTLAPLLAVALMASAGAASAASLSEGFESWPVPGWRSQNNSAPVGSFSWFPGNTPGLSGFPAQAGTTTSYIAANFQGTGDNGTISNWLMTPDLTFNNGDVVSFYTRTIAGSAYPDRLELRFASGALASPGATETSVGAYTTLLLSVNPSLALGGYPETWTQYSATISGLGGPTLGSVAFRYFVLDGGLLGSNSNFIGIDSVTITPVPEPGTWLLMALGLGAMAWRRKQAA